MNIKRRLEGLEKRAVAHSAITLEDLVSSSRGSAEAMRRCEAAIEDDPLVRSILETGRGRITANP